MATDPPVTCVRCGAGTELYRVDVPYCLRCMDELDREALLHPWKLPTNPPRK
jgi:hypothetical protein